MSGGGLQIQSPPRGGLSTGPAGARRASIVNDAASPTRIFRVCASLKFAVAIGLRHQEHQLRAGCDIMASRTRPRSAGRLGPWIPCGRVDFGKADWAFAASTLAFRPARPTTGPILPADFAICALRAAGLRRRAGQATAGPSASKPTVGDEESIRRSPPAPSGLRPALHPGILGKLAGFLRSAPVPIIRACNLCEDVGTPGPPSRCRSVLDRTRICPASRCRSP